jgi:hypothetical protein
MPRIRLDLDLLTDIPQVQEMRQRIDSVPDLARHLRERTA